MERLPQEVLENILSYLPQMELLQSIDKVCVTWKQLVSNSATLWRKIKFTSRNDCSLYMRHIPVVQNLVRNLTLSELSFNNLITADSNIKFPRLTTLCIEVSSNRVFDHIIKRCPKLEHIDLEFYQPMTMRYLDKLSVLNLKTFRIDCNRLLSNIEIFHFNESFHKFIEKQTNLQELSIETRQILHETTLIDIFKVCTSLKHFLLKDDSLPDAVFTNSKEKLKLNSIRICLCDGFSDRGLKALVERAKDLKIINLIGLPRISEKGLLYISQNCHDLEELMIGNSDGDDQVSSGLVHIAAGCPRLKFLHCLISFTPTDTQVISIANSCKHLQRLNIDEASLVTDKALFSIAESCLFLESVGFSGAEFFTIYGIVALILSCSKLKSLYFSSCEGISEMDLKCTEKNTTGEQEIKEKYSERIQSKGKKYSAIEVLDFESCTEVTNNTILQLVPLCPELKSLCAFCTLVEKDPVFEQQLYSMCKRLYKLEYSF